ncbi:hypothetical protein PAXRUDRAFT_592379 [Paxillus rubicundulus Ve08.2h10]|uniref:Unplaced genomic scaffold scaffold_489, whole genome shotgun sequence n=1 Tax=Paxillus rubicundulus Ve08.2h10 TaxID=930991 RepID=A0A0D0D5W2_9AGAM|nr:hypothetical protein PAXRUDRAFT_592379 [Paxillus rubicundulus Ve08.2h10]
MWSSMGIRRCAAQGTHPLGVDRCFVQGRSYRGYASCDREAPSIFQVSTPATRTSCGTCRLSMSYLLRRMPQDSHHRLSPAIRLSGLGCNSTGLVAGVLDVRRTHLRCAIMANQRLGFPLVLQVPVAHVAQDISCDLHVLINQISRNHTSRPMEVGLFLARDILCTLKIRFEFQ